MRRSPFCIIATASPSGQPWISPVFFNYDSAYRIVWESAKDALHSELVRQNRRVAIAVTELNAAAPTDVLYLECEAHEVTVEGLADALSLFLNGPHQKEEPVERTLSDYRDASPLRLYEARPQHVYVLERSTDGPGYVIDRRVEITLPEEQIGASG
jgi:hypothetical protein